MKTEDLVLDQGSEREVIEEIGEVFPDVSVAVFSQTLVIEAVNLCDLARLVVAAQNGYPLGVTDLESDEERYSLD